MAFFIQPAVVFGATEALPLRGFPAGEVRIHLSPEDFAKVQVTTESGSRLFAVHQNDGHWEPGPELDLEPPA